MFMPKTIVWGLVVATGLSPLSASAFSGPAHTFTVTEPTEIPGATLHPGRYTIHVVDHLSERYVVTVDALKGRMHSSFLAIENPDVPKPATAGRVLWPNAPKGNEGEKEYLRGWYFRGQPAVLEFVFPKTDAVAIARSNDAKVPAIDPASEGRPVTIKGLSKRDLELVTLWLLSSTHVGPQDSAADIQATRYKQVASLTHKPVVNRLPQTGSSLPWIALLGSFCILTAFGMRMRRPASVSRS
jgi:LPXTG-motif cell wall-anchored protein